MGREPVDADVTHTLALAAATSAPPRPRSGPDPLGAALEAVIDATPPGSARRELLVAIAERRPDLIVRRAPDWLADEDAEVIVHLPEHFLRVAVAGARRPWSQEAIERVAGALRGHGPADIVVSPVLLRDASGVTVDPNLVFDPAEIIGRVMADEDPALVRPAGVPDDPLDRWRVIGCEVWEWVLWECDDGRYALEAHISSGLVDFDVGELVDAALVAAWRRDGPAALDGAVEQLRARFRPR